MKCIREVLFSKLDYDRLSVFITRAFFVCRLTLRAIVHIRFVLVNRRSSILLLVYFSLFTIDSLQEVARIVDIYLKREIIS